MEFKSPNMVCKNRVIVIKKRRVFFTGSQTDICFQNKDSGCKLTVQMNLSSLKKRLFYEELKNGIGILNFVEIKSLPSLK